ncbi:hypothetical protein N7495_004237 [Penicillium taxi]|uniref:uncharacterized protein n=1 Tax=Penicillium taxi TaxID=168475 RepID=UPI002544F078|nr:uncharacterized protein N7495_004237 [Penicillium taxi]KAJ5899493.1 hypothetical protein N7495_004237 [Penicillium taxi]
MFSETTCQTKFTSDKIIIGFVDCDGYIEANGFKHIMDIGTEGSPVTKESSVDSFIAVGYS